MSEFGFYSIRRVDRNLRIISLNTNHFYVLNFWIYVTRDDPDGMLCWLIAQLEEAESLGENVYIIGHVPPGGHDVSRTWTRLFYQIIDRFEFTITAQFYGHVHRDEFKLFYEMPRERVSAIYPFSAAHPRPLNVAYMGPSVTPYKNLNPGFRVYEVNGDTNAIQNHFTYILDLNATLAAGTVKWELEYDALSAYNMADLSPSSWNHVVERLHVDLPLFQRFNHHRFKSSSFVQPCETAKCRASVICPLQNGNAFFPCSVDGFEQLGDLSSLSDILC